MSLQIIRNAAKAIIIQDNQILLIKHKREKIYYTLPGGGQSHNEELGDALIRECREELGAEIELIDIAFVSEYIADNHESSIQKKGFHQLDIFFECKLKSDINIHLASEIDDTQVGYEWIAIDKLFDIIMYPAELRKKIQQFSYKERTKTYLGEIH